MKAKTASTRRAPDANTTRVFSGIEKRLGIKLGPIMRSLLEVATRVRPDEPASAFPHVAGRSSFTLAIFDQSPEDIADEGITPKNVRPFAMDDKSHYGFLVGAKPPSSTDACPVVLVDWGEDEIRVVAEDLRTFVSQLGYSTIRVPAESADERKQLRAVDGLSAALAKAKLPKRLVNMKLESSLGRGDEDDGDERDDAADGTFKDQLQAYAAEREVEEARAKAPADIPTLKADLEKSAAKLREQITALADVDEGLTEMLRETLQPIEAALGRTAAGTFGICTSCKTRIDDARIKKMPAAALCAACDV